MGELGTLEADQSVLLKGRYGDIWVTFIFEGQPAWIRVFFLEIDNNEHLRLPEVEAVSKFPVQVSNESKLLDYFKAIVNDPRYNPEISVIHKYIDNLSVQLSNNKLSFYVSKPIANVNDHYSLSIDLIFGSILLSNAGEISDWKLTLIEVIDTRNSSISDKFFVSGKDRIETIANDPSRIYEFMEIDLGSANIVDTNKSESNLTSTAIVQDSFPLIEYGCPDGCTFHKEGCDIKGNISFDIKEKIYHIPGQEYYSITSINVEYGERWFCTEEEAIANGWRKSYK